MKKIFFFVLTFSFYVGAAMLTQVAIASEVEPVNMQNEKNIEQKFMELSDELQKQFIDAVNEFLEKELKHLKSKNEVPRESLRSQIEKYEKELTSEPKNPETYFSLARLYDQKGEGASAIIYTQKAEEIFLERQDVKGVAEARRSLRHYFNKYDYKPEDFELNK
jgi:cytochrome c-type biogenesis protein CcmH/NrfG